MQQLSSTKDDHNQQQGNTNATALVLLNTRGLGGYKSIEEMVKPKSEMPWGNRFTFLPVSIPKLTGGVTDDHANLNPLRFVKEAHWIIKRKRNSAVVYLTGWILEIMRKFRGHECHGSANEEVATGSGVVVEKWWWYGGTMATMLTVVKRRQRWMAVCDDSSEGLCSRGGEEVVARYFHNTMKNSSLAMSNLIGSVTTVEKMALANHPIKGLYFTFIGSPEVLGFDDNLRSRAMVESPLTDYFGIGGGDGDGDFQIPVILSSSL
ncbi:hypothetical protein RHGRI_017675 [Rhododendron griersonianum]|uniref:O-acyltransferase WSD1 C-terminal domain-containing protein n=1 Tax=Rhododendron griersonianum TaxID=479676 RepID=A0AAV6JYN7_9ERIC|nr:hypothetical protein RHGRI_017675 [Rhododendron griersonianum]